MAPVNCDRYNAIGGCHLATMGLADFSFALNWHSCWARPRARQSPDPQGGMGCIAVPK